MSISEDIKALEEAMATMPSALTSKRFSFSNDPVAQSIIYQRILMDWDFEFMKVCSPSRIRRLLDALTQAESVCAEAYQVVGCLLDDAGNFNSERATKILDNLSEARVVHDDVLPWDSGTPVQAKLSKAIELLRRYGDGFEYDHNGEIAAFLREAGK